MNYLNDNKYIESTKTWLESRYKATDENGVYIAHQPIYGFKKLPCEKGVINRYIITNQILTILKKLDFSNILDVGGSEGYKSALIRKLFNVRVHSSDLSIEACNRAREIFNIPSSSHDICNLSFEDESFDIVICSETLEHVPNIKTATDELLRVAKKCVLITVPQESQETVAQNIAQGELHAHIHALNLMSFNYLEKRGYQVKRYKHLSIFTRYIRMLFCDEKKKGTKFPPIVYEMLNALVSLVYPILGKPIFKILISLDRLLAKFTPSFGLCFLIIKDNSILNRAIDKNHTLSFLDFKVPHHYIDNSIKDIYK